MNNLQSNRFTSALFNKKTLPRDGRETTRKTQAYILRQFHGDEALTLSHNALVRTRTLIGFFPVKKCIDGADLRVIIFVCLYLVVTVEIFYRIRRCII
jgi:hypothetical protein